MIYKTCTTCKLLKPRVEPHYSPYGNGNAKRVQWKHVCNDCIAAAHEKRKRQMKPAFRGPDMRDQQHPLEDVFRTWTATSPSAPSPARRTPASPSFTASTRYGKS